MLVKYRQRVLQLATAKHVDVEIAAAVRVRSEDSSAEETLNVFQRLEVTPVHPDFEGRLLLVAGERTFSDDESHGVAELEGLHGTQYSKCATYTQGGTIHIPSSTPPPAPLGALPTRLYLPGTNCQRTLTPAEIVSIPGSTGTDLSATWAAISDLMYIGRGFP